MAQLTRRQFGAGLAAVATATLVPAPTVAAATQTAATLDPALIATLDGELAVVARRMVRLDRLFSYVDSHYFTDDRCWHRWENYYGELIASAQWFYEIDRESQTEAERTVIAWARQRIPRADDLIRQKWTPIEGLSARFKWRETILYEAFMQLAEAALALDYVTYKGLQNPFYPEHAEIVETYRRAEQRIGRIIRGRLSGPWSWPRAEAPADLILLRRVWHIWKDGDGAVARKFRGPALRRLRDRRITWIATDNGRSDRMWTWVYPP